VATADFDAPPPHGVDVGRPSVARVYDYMLEGTSNWAVDREFGDRALAQFPLFRRSAKANRMFLHRAVRYLTGLGVTQFVDIGSGLPTVGHVHTIADEVAPGRAKVVYVDHEPVAVAHSEVLLERHGDPSRHRAVFADLREPRRLWQAVSDTGVINMDRPMAVLLIAVLHIQQPGPTGLDIGPEVLGVYRDLLPNGSYLALSHVTDDGVPPGLAQKLADLERMYADAGNPVVWRSRPEIESLFGDFTPVDPGATWTPLWHPELAAHDVVRVDFDDPRESVIWAGVGHKA